MLLHRTQSEIRIFAPHLTLMLWQFSCLEGTCQIVINLVWRIIATRSGFQRSGPKPEALMDDTIAIPSFSEQIKEHNSQRLDLPSTNAFFATQQANRSSGFLLASDSIHCISGGLEKIRHQFQNCAWSVKARKHFNCVNFSTLLALSWEHYFISCKVSLSA